MTHNDQTVLIAGATSDMARAIAHVFAAKGHPLALAARDGAARLAADAADLGLRHGVPVTVMDFDLKDRERYDALIAAAGPHVIVCVAGLLGDQVQARTDQSLAYEIMMVNYVWNSLFLAAAANYLEAKGGGAIIGVSSVAGDRGRGSNYVYGSAKAGFTAFLSGLRNRLADRHVQVLTVKPGFVATRMTEGMKLPAVLTAMPAKVGEAVYGAWKGRRDTVYVLGIWRLIMLIIVHLPEAVFKRLKL